MQSFEEAMEGTFEQYVGTMQELAGERPMPETDLQTAIKDVLDIYEGKSSKEIAAANYEKVSASITIFSIGRSLLMSCGRTWRGYAMRLRN